MKVLVTGASRGIGFAILEALLEEGYDVIAHASSEASLDKIKDKLGNKVDIDDKGNGFPSRYTLLENLGRITLVAADLSDPKQVAALCTRIKKEFKGDLYALVNNAGITLDGPLVMQKESKINKILQVNLQAPIMLCKAAARVFHGKGTGCIVNISSVVGQAGNPFQTIYAATKAGIIGFSKSLAQEVCMLKNTDRIRVNVVAPGFIATDMTDAIPDEMAAKIQSGIPMNRTGNPSEIAEAVVFLLSQKSSYITGEVLSVNGGMY
jgi:3-oxoacyl-[acyl-carrier protein] reductase